MDYHVARDDASNTVAQSWMVAANQNGIPTAFIVDKTGTIVWIGHPMDGLDETLGQVIAGKYGVTTAKKAFQQKQAAAAAEDAKREQLNKLFGPALELANQRKFREAIGAIDKVIKTRPEYARDNNIVYLKFVLYMSYDQAAGQAFMAKAASHPGLDPRLLNKVAWGIVAPDSKIKTPDYASAVTIAKAAVLATRGQEPAVLDTLSYAYEKNGDIANAIATEEKAAVNVRNDNSQKGKEVRARLMQLKAKLKNGRR